MKVIKDLFVIPSKDKYILYAPLKGNMMLVNGEVISLLQCFSKDVPVTSSETLDQLIKAGIVVEEEPEVIFSWDEDATKSTFLGVIPTTDCNLRCQYCYSSAGEHKDMMDWPIAKKGVDFIVGNALLKDKCDAAHIAFMGGGEPFYGASWDLVKKIVNYALIEGENKKMPVRFGGTTNGVLNNTKIDWLIEHFHHLTLSFDGPADIQNKQRPLSNGGPSFDLVMNTIRKLDESNFNYSVRCTISPEGLPRMGEIVEFFAENTHPDYCFIEPIFECGRCKTTNAVRPDLITFAKEYVKVKERADSIKFPLRHIMDDISLLTNISCGAGIGNFILTPTGMVTACPEIIKAEDPFAKIFIYGQYNPSTDKFDFSRERLDYLRSRKVEKIVPCGDCFAKFNCGGDCYIKATRQGSLFDNQSNVRCQMFRDLLKYKLEKELEVKNG